MIAYYALGGGLGHLTRGRRVLDALGIEATFVTASSYASDARVTGGRPVLLLPASLEGSVDAHRTWLRSLGCERLIVDTFPGGIQGELCGLDVPMDLVARRVRWDEYRRVVPGPLPRFDTIYRLEDLDPREDSDVECGNVVAAVLCASRSSRCGEEERQLALPHSTWLVVHSGPEHEVRELVAYANDLQRIEKKPRRTLVATRCDIELPESFERIDEYPVNHLYATAEKIITAAGFNVMLETQPYRHKHHAIPFPRKFDDQFYRTRNAMNPINTATKARIITTSNTANAPGCIP